MIPVEKRTSLSFLAHHTTWVFTNISFLKLAIQLLDHQTRVATLVSTSVLLYQRMLTNLDFANFIIMLGYDTFLTKTPVTMLSMLWYQLVWTMQTLSLLYWKSTEFQLLQNRAGQFSNSRYQQMWTHHLLFNRTALVNFKICTIIYQCINGSST